MNAAAESMQEAVAEIRNAVAPNSDGDDLVDTIIGIDGSWQKRRHSSS